MSNEAEFLQAFPMCCNNAGDAEYAAKNGYGGMTLRDYFAIRAPVTIADAERTLNDEDAGFVSWGTIMKRLCQMQLAYADVMLKTRTAD